MTKSHTLIRAALMRFGTTAITLLAAGAAAAAPALADAHKKVFVTCPIVRNTTLPCWMAQDAGELYFLGPQTDLSSDFYPPQFNHKVLVEAEVADGPKVCGGTPMKNITASVLPDFDETCNVMLPAEGYPDPPNERGSGPSGKRGEPPPPPRGAYARRAEFVAPTPPFQVKTFSATFNADSDRKWAPANRMLGDAQKWANAVNASRIEITGYRAAIRLSNGQDFLEDENVAELRAKTAAEALTTLGLPKTTKLVVTWDKKPTPSLGLGKDVANRKVVVKIIPGAAPAKTADQAAPPPAGH